MGWGFSVGIEGGDQNQLGNFDEEVTDPDPRLEL